MFPLCSLDGLDPVSQRGLRHGPHPHQRVLIARGAHHADPLLDPRVSQPVRLRLRLVRAVNLHRVFAPSHDVRLGLLVVVAEARVFGVLGGDATRATRGALLRGNLVLLLRGWSLALLVLGRSRCVLLALLHAASLPRRGDDVVVAQAEALHDLAVTADALDAFELIIAEPVRVGHEGLLLPGEHGDRRRVNVIIGAVPRFLNHPVRERAADPRASQAARHNEITAEIGTSS